MCPFKTVKGVICLCCMWTTRLRVGLSVSLIYSLMGRCHTRLSPCHYSEEKQRSCLSRQWGEDVRTVKMSKEKIGGQGADLWLIPSILGATFGTKTVYLPELHLHFQKAAVHPSDSRSPWRSLAWTHICIYTQLTPTKLLLFSLYMRDKSATPGNDKQRGGGGVIKARLDKTAQRQLFVKRGNIQLQADRHRNQVWDMLTRNWPNRNCCWFCRDDYWGLSQRTCFNIWINPGSVCVPHLTGDPGFAPPRYPGNSVNLHLGAEPRSEPNTEP